MITCSEVAKDLKAYSAKEDPLLWVYASPQVCKINQWCASGGETVK